MINHVKLLDCTLRDGGYHNAWDFQPELIEHYFSAMDALGVDVIEVGFRFTRNNGFKGPCAYSTENWIKQAKSDISPKIAVMLNAADLIAADNLTGALHDLFPAPVQSSAVDIVRIACHLREYQHILDVTQWLSGMGYRVGLNLMQIAQHADADIAQFVSLAEKYPIEVVYFADSTGSLRPERTAQITTLFKQNSDKAVGIHAHDNLGLALENTLTAAEAGATWLDSTVTGMGRGPGNTRTEELICELSDHRTKPPNMVPLLEIMDRYFTPMKAKYKWGTNPYYYLAGKEGIHPTYIQSMLNDSRFSPEDIIEVINTLKTRECSSFSQGKLGSALNYYTADTKGSWAPSTAFQGKDALILGTGPGARVYKAAIEGFIEQNDLVTVALNTQNIIEDNFIDFRIASQPARMMADLAQHKGLKQPIIAPFSSLPPALNMAFADHTKLDFGMQITENGFTFGETSCCSPSYLVFAYALAMLTSGKVNRIFLAGFDGYPSDDTRGAEIKDILKAFRSACTTPLIAITPTRHDIDTISPFGRVEEIS